MAYVFTTPSLGMPPITRRDTTAQWKLGDIQKAIDPDLGTGEFIYVQANGAITGSGYAVQIDEAFQAAMISTTGDAEGDMVGIPNAAFADNDYGWVQVKGVCVIRVAANAAANTPLNTTGTAGQLDDDGAVASMQIYGAYLTTANGGSAGTAAAVINYPSIADVDANVVRLTGTQSIAGAKTFTDAMAMNGNVDLGNTVSDTIGFYGSTKVAQPSGAGQAAVTLTLKTALVTTLKTALVLTAVTAAGTTGAIKTTGATYGYTTSTQANKIVALVNQLKVDVASIKARVDQGVVDVASIKARIDQAVVDMGAVNTLATAIRAGLVPTTGVGILKGAA